MARRPMWFGVLVLLAAGAWTYSSSTDSVLTAQTLAGAPSGGVASLQFAPFATTPDDATPTVDRNDPIALVRSWSCYEGAWRTEWGVPPSTSCFGMQNRVYPQLSNCPVDGCVDAVVTARAVLLARAAAIVLLGLALGWLVRRLAEQPDDATPAAAEPAAPDAATPAPATNPTTAIAAVGPATSAVATGAFVVFGLLCQLSRYRGAEAAWEGSAVDGLGWFRVAGAAWWLGLVALALAVLPLIAPLLTMVRPWLTALVTRLWFQTLLVGIFLGLLMHEQAIDVLRGWSSAEPTTFGLSHTFLGAVAMTLGLGIVLTISGARLLRFTPDTFPALPERRVYLGAVALVGGTAWVAAVALSAPGLKTFAIIVGLVGVISLVDWSSWTTVAAPTGLDAPSFSRMRVLAPLVGAAALAVLSLSVIKAYGPNSQLRTDLPAADVALLVLAFVLLGLTPLWGRALRWGQDRLAYELTPIPTEADAGLDRGADPGDDEERALRGRAIVIGAGVVLLGAVSLGLSVSTDAIANAQELGAITVVASFLASIAFGFATLGFLADLACRWPVSFALVLPPVLRAAGFSRPPVVGMLAIWALIPAVGDHGGHNDVRRVAPPDEAATVAPLDDFLGTWAVAQSPDRGMNDATAAGPSTTTTAPSPEPAAVPTPVPGPGPDTPRAPQPLVFVSTSGGGIRAAFWTAAVLDCIIERDPGPGGVCSTRVAPEVAAQRRERIFAMSGISGGSLGLVEYDAFVRASVTRPGLSTELGIDGCREATGQYAPFGPDDEPEVPNCTWYRMVLNDDFLSPTFGAWLYGDLVPDAWLHRQHTGDRAAALERAWAQAWGGDSPLDDGFLATQAPLATGAGADAWRPLLFLNSYSVQDGCRLNVSAALSADGSANDCTQTAAPALVSTHDIGTYLCPGGDGASPSADGGTAPDADLELSTAALLSARFPFVTPAGRLARCGTTGDADRAIFAVDGGYRDTSAASTVVELWPEVQRWLESDAAAGVCVTPAFIQIDNDYAHTTQPTGSAKQSQPLAPLQAIMAAPQGYTAGASQEAVSTFAPNAIGIRTTAHPGDAAPLGWALSDKSMDDLQRELNQAVVSIQQARALLDGELSSAAGAATYGGACSR